jgi:hypothetical protein
VTFTFLYTDSDEDDETILKKLAPLPKKPPPERQRTTRAKNPTAVLTADNSMSFLEGSVTRSELARIKKENKAKGIKVESSNVQVSAITERVQNGKMVRFLGSGASRLVIMPGLAHFRCVRCTEVFSPKDKGKDKEDWVTCRSCRKPSHRVCMQKFYKCFCGALSPRNK